MKVIKSVVLRITQRLRASALEASIQGLQTCNDHAHVLKDSPKLEKSYLLLLFSFKKIVL